MKKTLALSMLAATVIGGMLLTLPAEAYGCHRGWHHNYHAANYNYRHNHVFHGQPVHTRLINRWGR